MGMIRVSDEVERQLKEMADGRSMSATVEMLIKATTMKADEMFGGGGGELVAAFAGVVNENIDRKFNELKSLIEDTTVDRVAGVRKGPKTSVYLDWLVVKELFYDFLDESSPEWTCKAAYEGAAEGSDLDCRNWKTDGTLIFDEGQVRVDWVKITPRVKEFLVSKGVDI